MVKICEKKGKIQTINRIPISTILKQIQSKDFSIPDVDLNCPAQVQFLIEKIGNWINIFEKNSPTSVTEPGILVNLQVDPGLRLIDLAWKKGPVPALAHLQNKAFEFLSNMMNLFRTEMENNLQCILKRKDIEKKNLKGRRRNIKKQPFEKLEYYSNWVNLFHSLSKVDLEKCEENIQNGINQILGDGVNQIFEILNELFSKIEASCLDKDETDQKSVNQFLLINEMFFQIDEMRDWINSSHITTFIPMEMLSLRIVKYYFVRSILEYKQDSGKKGHTRPSFLIGQFKNLLDYFIRSILEKKQDSNKKGHTGPSSLIGQFKNLLDYFVRSILEKKQDSNKKGHTVPSSLIRQFKYLLSYFVQSMLEKNQNSSKKGLRILLKEAPNFKSEFSKFSDLMDKVIFESRENMVQWVCNFLSLIIGIQYLFIKYHKCSPISEEFFSLLTMLFEKLYIEYLRVDGFFLKERLNFMFLQYSWNRLVLDCFWDYQTNSNIASGSFIDFLEKSENNEVLDRLFKEKIFQIRWGKEPFSLSKFFKFSTDKIYSQFNTSSQTEIQEYYFNQKMDECLIDYCFYWTEIETTSFYNEIIEMYNAPVTGNNDIVRRLRGLLGCITDYSNDNLLKKLNEYRVFWETLEKVYIFSSNLKEIIETRALEPLKFLLSSLELDVINIGGKQISLRFIKKGDVS